MFGFSLISTLIDVVSTIFVLRLWFQFCRIDFYNPYSQSLAKVTNPVLKPLNKIFPTIKRINTAALAVIFILGLLIYPLNTGHWSFDYVEEMILIGFLHIVKTLGTTVLYALFFSAILSWFNRQLNPVQILLYQLTEMFLRPVRKLLPETGMIDFSPMVVALLLMFGNEIMFNLFSYLWLIA